MDQGRQSTRVKKKQELRIRNEHGNVNCQELTEILGEILDFPPDMGWERKFFLQVSNVRMTSSNIEIFLSLLIYNFTKTV